jgi:ADP-ribosylglycohydrolase
MRACVTHLVVPALLLINSGGAHAWDDDAEDRVRGALWGAFIGDALAMPVHWYYSLPQLKHDFGRIDGYYAPKPRFKGSIMSLSNTGGGGRGTSDGDIVGSVILHGKKQFWGRGGDYHYHHGLLPGENTLDANIVQLLLGQLTTDQGDLSVQTVRERYVAFMTSPGNHNDTYASTTHRMFFKNYASGVPLDQCTDNDDHNVDAIDALPTLIPYVLAQTLRSGNPLQGTELRALVSNVMGLFRKDSNGLLQEYGERFGGLLSAVLSRKQQPGETKEGLRTVVKAAADGISFAVERSVEQTQDPMSACYLSTSYPALLHFAFKHAGQFEDALLASTNAGGENVARGACLGALMGAYSGQQAIPTWMLEGLTGQQQISKDIDNFILMLKDQPTGSKSEL